MNLKLTPTQHNVMTALELMSGESFRFVEWGRGYGQPHRILNDMMQWVGSVSAVTLQSLVKRGLIEASDYGDLIEQRQPDGTIKKVEAFVKCWMRKEVYP